LFQHVPADPGTKGFGGHLDFGMHGEYDEFRHAAPLAQEAYRLEAVEPRHGEIRHNHIGTSLLSGSYECLSILYRPDQLKALSQQGTESFDEKSVIIGKKHLGAAYRNYLAISN
jgi:hypothetical protein